MYKNRYWWWVIGAALVAGVGVVVTTQLFVPNTTTIPATDELPVAAMATTTGLLPEPPRFGIFSDTPGHPGAGMAKIYKTDNNEILRLTDFSATAGPDLFVYLATDLDATAFINLGVLKSTSGNQNYDIPAGTNLAEYRYALVWCKRFGVLFMSAELK